MSRRLFLLGVENRILNPLSAIKRNGMDFRRLKIQIFEIRCQDLPPLVPLGNDVQVFPLLSVKVIVGFDVALLFLPVPAEESEFDCVAKFVGLVLFPGLQLILLFLLHHSLHVPVADSPFLDRLI